MPRRGLSTVLTQKHRAQSEIERPAANRPCDSVRIECRTQWANSMAMLEGWAS